MQEREDLGETPVARMSASAVALLAACAVGLSVGLRLPATRAVALAAAAGMALALFWPFRFAVRSLIVPQLRARRWYGRLAVIAAAALVAAAMVPRLRPAPAQWRYVDDAGAAVIAPTTLRRAWGSELEALWLHGRVPEHPEWHSRADLRLRSHTEVLRLWLAQPEENVVDEHGQPHPGGDGVEVTVEGLGAGAPVPLGSWRADPYRDPTARRWHELRLAIPSGVRAVRVDVSTGPASVHDHLLVYVEPEVLLRGRWIADLLSVCFVCLCFGWLVSGTALRPRSGEPAALEPTALEPAAARVPAWLCAVAVGMYVLVAGVVAGVYVASERTIYIWDFVCYQELTAWLTGLSRVDLAGAWREIVRSIEQDPYNLVAAVPLAALQRLVGESRIAFVVSIVAVYGSVAALSLLLLCRRFFAPRTPPGWGTAAVLVAMLSFPWTLVPVLRGQVDIGALAIALTILALYFARPLPELSGRQLVAIGLLLAGIVIFRKWNAFWVVSFFVMMAVDAGARLLAARSLRPAVLLALGRPLAVAGVVAGLAFLAAAAPLVAQMVGIDYANAYGAYRFGDGLAVRLGHVRWTFGWGSPALVAVCWVLLAVWSETRRFAVLVFVQAAVAWLHFTQVQDFGIHHWYLLQPAVLAVVGICLARLVGAIRTTGGRCLLLGLFALAGVLVSVRVLVPSAAEWSDPLRPVLPGATTYPLVRDDVPELRRLVAAIDAELARAGKDARLYVLASSDVLTDAHLTHGEPSIGVPRVSCRVLPTVHLDRRDGFPSALFEAEVVCTTSPPATHLAPAEHQVIVQPALSLIQGTGIGRAYERLPATFQLDRGLVACLFRRVRPPTEEEIGELSAQLRAAHPDLPFVWDPAFVR